MGFVISFRFHVYISILIVETKNGKNGRYVDRSQLRLPQYLVWAICFSFDEEEPQAR